MAELTVVINNKFGIHARPAATLVKTAASYKSSVKLTSGGKTVDAKSILGVMSLGVKNGTTVMFKAEGEDAQDCLLALKKLVDSDFGESY